MTARYDDTGPANVPWFVKVGDPISKTWLITDENGAAVDVSGATLTGAIRTGEDSTLTATATFTMSKPSVSGNNAVKALLSAGISTVGSYWWAIRVAMADGETVYRGQGTLVVEAKGV
jgi:hypothetical protein